MIKYGLIFLLLYSVHLLLKEIVNLKKGKTMNYLIFFLSLATLMGSLASLVLMLMGIDE
ncbi:hypothetical protein ERICIV_00824 [Paenibacillus larvae subsp. larvae]|uniref:Uncharacterized protein n=1 Tax=Paenibacillus larvae subsp. larvae TaxID=147375 RepID=A0A2L1TWM7_9BACL|nr:hypothetical protein [Paenibacillus larvae]AVF25028.1 hypothetical protein ERICIII_00821 [Paenibacillus larvae subsp. larvae]AVF29792.1 hypothetical protein ERICIV_00824 [Paenibacillus larvae subsp. larvae]MCY9501571.1 hypothetical protein [Paenibacillus larvae]MCY9511578.1 hypothetical protein [Paenibacillus larvae]MCY9526510.1 hypothetical protein [Paenibacillus larvae]